MPRLKIIVSALITIAVGFALWSNSAPEKSPCVVSEEIRTVRGHSLAGLIEPESEITILRGYYKCHEVMRGDIVAYNYAGNSNPIIKRVVGLPGDVWTLERNNNKTELVINGVLQTTTLSEPYRFGDSGAKMLSLYPSPIPPDAYLILGNLPSGSTDATKFGLVSKDGLIGRIDQRIQSY